MQDGSCSEAGGKATEEEKKESQKPEQEPEEEKAAECDKNIKYTLLDDDLLEDIKLPNYDSNTEELYEPTFQIQPGEKKSEITLQDCLDDFASYELLDESSEYKCERCQKRKGFFPFLGPSWRESA